LFSMPQPTASSPGLGALGRCQPCLAGIRLGLGKNSAVAGHPFAADPLRLQTSPTLGHQGLCSRSARFHAGTTPSRIRRGGSLVTSITVDPGPPASGPASRIRSSPCATSGGRWSISDTAG